MSGIRINNRRWWKFVLFLGLFLQLACAARAAEFQVHIVHTQRAYSNGATYKSDATYILSMASQRRDGGVVFHIKDLAIRPMSYPGSPTAVADPTNGDIEKIRWNIFRNGKGKLSRAVAEVDNKKYNVFNNGHLAPPKSGGDRHPPRSISLGVNLLQNIVLDLPAKPTLGEQWNISNETAVRKDDMSFGSDSIPGRYLLVRHHDNRYTLRAAMTIVSKRKQALQDYAIFLGKLQLTNDSKMIIPDQDMQVWSHFKGGSGLPPQLKALKGGYLAHRRIIVSPVNKKKARVGNP